ncbi:hypothetical protein BGW38_007556 [Lunasporangiospora selenospora]|uniref:Vps72/YL1 C-terminal domain-containing protein n=1 Tax=Lunasporangiospora selenospora TaxID=979761 RepID=A0A9P6G2N2_9FUNG|nr:hypothetical protein BGW38_007556 [Lunasporangiospora selenospora]
MAANRERRANAGNRLHALLNNEEEMEELFDDEGVDEEFLIEGKEQEDIVDSDFDQSSSDEGEKEDGEINLEEDPDEAKVRKKQQAMLNHLRTGKSSMSIPSSDTGKGTLKPKRSTTSSAPIAISAVKKKKTVSAMAAAAIASISTSTSAAATPSVASIMARFPIEIRKSSRRTTVLNKQETELRLQEYEARKAMQPKRERVIERKMTQEELLREAKKTEELNLASLQSFKAMELEKKRVVKKKEVVMENFVRYHSFAEWVGHGPLIQALADTGVPTPGGTRPPTRPGSRAGSVAPESSSFGGGIHPQSLVQSLQQHQQQEYTTSLPQSVAASRDSSPARQLKVEFNEVGENGSGSKTHGSALSGLDRTRGHGDIKTAQTATGAGAGARAGVLSLSGRKGAGTESVTGTLTPAHYATMNMSAGSIARKRKRLHPSQMCGRNWVTFVGFEDEESPINEWSFVESYPERKPMCPITGLPAKYKDPRSGIPYANKEAYKILQNVVRHGYVWSNGLNAYCHDVAQPLPKGVPAGMAEALMGGQQLGEGIVLKDGDLVSAGVPGGGGGGYTYRRRPQQQQ